MTDLLVTLTHFFNSLYEETVDFNMFLTSDGDNHRLVVQYTGEGCYVQMIAFDSNEDELEEASSQGIYRVVKKNIRATVDRFIKLSTAIALSELDEQKAKEENKDNAS